MLLEEESVIKRVGVTLEDAELAKVDEDAAGMVVAVVDVPVAAGLLEGGGPLNDGEGEGFLRPYTAASKTLLGTLATLRSW